MTVILANVFAAGCIEGSGGGSAPPLTAKAGDDVTLMMGEGVTLTATTDGGVGPFLYRWSLEDQPDASTLALTENLTDRMLVVDELTEQGRYLFRVRITDSAGATDTDFVVVNVAAPIGLTATSDTALRVVGESAQLGIEFADTSGLENVTYLWEVTRGEATFSDPAVQSPEVTVTSSDTVELRVTVTGEVDGIPATDTSEVIIVGVPNAMPQVVIANSGAVTGDIVMELFTEESPLTCANFLRHVDDQDFDGVIWHRVVANFVIQAGAFERVDGQIADTETARDPVPSEAPNGLSNTRAFVSMALRGQDANSGTNQFFINLGDNSSLDNGTPPFAPFARVVEGMDVVDEIAAVQVGNEGQFMDVPVDDVVITSIRRQ